MASNLLLKSALDLRRRSLKSSLLRLSICWKMLAMDWMVGVSEDALTRVSKLSLLEAELEESALEKGSMEANSDGTALEAELEASAVAKTEVSSIWLEKFSDESVVSGISSTFGVAVGSVVGSEIPRISSKGMGNIGLACGVALAFLEDLDILDDLKMELKLEIQRLDCRSKA